MEIENVAIDKLIQYEFNNKIHDDTQIDRIANSIKEFGFLQPLVIEKDNTIIVGHGRYLGAKKLGLKELPCVRVENLTEEQIKKYRILDNRLNESAYNMENLKVELDELDNFNIGDLEISIDELFPDLQELDDEEQKVEEDEAPKVSAEAKIVGGGDLISLGNHRLLCGDATKIEDLEELMNGEKADLLFTDPPYGVSYENKTKKILKTKEYTKIANDDLKGNEFEEFLQKVFTNIVGVLKETASYYVFSCQGGDQELTMMTTMRNAGMPCRHQLIRVKDTPVFSMGRLDYDYKHEPMLYGRVKKHDFKRKGSQDKSVREFKRSENKLHPTMKPVELIGNALLNSTDKNEIVLDCFGGSGSTLIACEQLNRKCFMLELDPKYCEVIIKRFHKINPDAEIKCLNRNIDLTVLFDEE